MEPDINLVKTTLRYRLRLHSVRYIWEALFKISGSIFVVKLPHVDKNSDNLNLFIRNNEEETLQTCLRTVVKIVIYVHFNFNFIGNRF